MINETNLKLTEGLNKEQLQAVLNPIDTCTKIVAGAGTGKTKIISKRFVKLYQDLLEQGIEKPLEHLLVITFTEKAAGEMKTRIFDELKKNGIHHFSQQDWISTIHGFCSKILRTHSIEANLSPAFKLGDEKVLQDIYDGLIKKITYGEYLTVDKVDEIAESLGLKSSILSAESLNAFNKINDLEKVFADILAVIQKIKSLGKTPKEFMEKSIISIKKLAETIKKLPLNLHDKDEYPTVWEKYLKPYMAPTCEFYTMKETQKGASFDGIYKDVLKIAFSNRRGNPANWEIKSDFPQCLDEINEVEILMTQVIALIYALYQNELEKRDLIDYDDLINKTLFILENNEEIRTHYQNYFRHIIVDEFQDTNGAQLRLLTDLLGNEAPNITFVGDKKQSIYAFRYAQMENLDLLHSLIEKKYGRKYPQIALKYNYRSTPQVLDAVNHVTKEELCLNETLSANPTVNFILVENSVKTSQLVGYNNSAEYNNCEAKYIASEIISAKTNYDLNNKDFAVLVKSHAQADILEKELLKYGIPSVKKSNISYFKKPIVKNVQAILKFASNIRDEISLVRILKIYFNEREIFELKLELTKNLTEEESLLFNLCEQILKLLEDDKIQNLNIKSDMKNFLSHIFEINYKIQEMKKTNNLMQIYHELMKEISPYHNLFATEKLLADIDLVLFEKILADFIKSTDYLTLKTFCEYIDKIKVDKNFELPDIGNSQIDAVHLLTIHASKGLEFPYVFVANITKGTQGDKGNIKFDFNTTDEEHSFGIVINTYNGKENPKCTIYKNIWYNPKEEAEQKRRFYVAISRAEKFLNVLQSNKSAKYVENMPFKTAPINVNELKLEKQPLKNVMVSSRTNKTFDTVKILQAPSEEIQKISFSQINTFAHCQNKYLLKYKYGYPELFDTKDVSLVGSAVHNLIYHSFLHGESLNNPEMFLTNSKIDETQIKEIKSIYQQFKTSNYSPEKVKICLPEYHFQYQYGNVIFTGDIDLVIKNEDGTVSLVDFKTNKDIDKSLSDYTKQLYIYKLALEDDGQKIKDTILLNLRPDEIKEINVEIKELSQAKLALDNDIKAVLKCKNDSNLTISINPYCKTCGYNYICSRS